ncbi:MAG: hypothetical protein R3E10_16215 [Gemmatimonadota bacterium]
MILRCNYEETQALRHGATAVLGIEGAVPCSIEPSLEGRFQVETLLPRLTGDLSLQTLVELRNVEVAVRTIVECLEAEMKSVVVQSHPGDEGAVDAYFEFAHSFAVLSRISEIRGHMEAMIELVTGHRPDEETARTFQFPD